MPEVLTDHGAHPEVFLDTFDAPWSEYMHYLYLPVAMPGQRGVRLPERLEFLRQLIYSIHDREVPPGEERFIYVTARRGFATPGNPLNRPGWHADGFGTDDINYVWSDSFPTMFAAGSLGLRPEIADDHIKSVRYWTDILDYRMNVGFAKDHIDVYQGEPLAVYRLDPRVIHGTADIPAPGGDRSFFKISVSRSKYNLRGNSHNYLFDYDWVMHDRSVLRNDPSFAGGDAGPQ